MNRKLSLKKFVRFWHRRWKVLAHFLNRERGHILVGTVWAFAVAVGLLAAGSNLTVVQAPSSPAVVIPRSRALPVPVTSANNIFILDMLSQAVLYQKNSDISIHPASTTKMLTALVVIKSFPLDQIITVDQPFKEGAVLGLMPGERITVEKLLYAMLIPSANDAAEILAENYPGGRANFISAMNATAKSLAMYHSHFTNPTGLDEQEHYSSAADLARLAQTFIREPELARIAATENAVISSVDNSTTYSLTNLNTLLGKVPGVMGVKTGFTDLAGQSLITYINRDGHPLIISVLGSTDRFSDTLALINWSYANFSWY